MAERSGERTALGGGDLAQPVHGSDCLHEALDKAIAPEENLMSKTSPDTRLAKA
jgi:hypothetical protein